ncbi:MAG: RIP metalloprotease RseP, partial [Campylobacter sp.]
MKGIILTAAILAVGLYAYSWHFLITVLVISFLIFFHELGHFLAARLLKVGVLKFSVGFGQSVYSRTIGGTEYAIGAIPLGGYVSLKGQEDSKPGLKNEDTDSYTRLSPLGRIFILFAGPFFNFALAFLIFIALGHIGVERLAPTVGKVLENSAAASAGLQKGDKILNINGIKISEWDEISKNVNLTSTAITLE